MEFRIFKNIRRIKSEWIHLQGSNIYQSYEYNLLMHKYRKSSISSIRNRNRKIAYCVLYRNKVPVVIAPLIIDETPKVVRILGYGTNSGNLDFIYKEKKYVKSMLEYCISIYKDYKFEFTFVLEESPLVELMKQENVFENYKLIISNYNNFYFNLSKNMRQNIRTAYNRIEKDGRKYRICKLKGSECNKNFIKNISKVYMRRKETWNGEIPLGKYKAFIIEKRDIVFSSIKTIKSVEIYILELDGEIAAFFIDYKEFGNIVRVPRLAINEEYSRYSPGIVLINEYLKDKHNFVYDLGRGQESYKLKLNGVLYRSYNLVV